MHTKVMCPSKQSKIQDVVANVRRLLSPESNSSGAADKSTQCSTYTIARRKDWDNISASTVYARKNSVVNMLVDIIKAVSNLNTTQPNMVRPYTYQV